MGWVRGVFWSREFYAQALTQGRDLGFGVLAILTLVTTLILGAYLLPHVSEIRPKLDEITATLPTIRFENGHAVADAERQPQVIPLDREGDVVLVLATNRADGPPELVKSYAPEHGLVVHVSRDYLTTYDTRNLDLRAYEFKRFMHRDATFTHKDFASLIMQFMLVGLVFGVVMLWLVKWVGAILLAAALGAVGLLWHPRQGPRLQYRDRVRLASYSLVPVLLLQAILRGQASFWIILALALAHYLFVLSLADRGLCESTGSPDEPPPIA